MVSLADGLELLGLLCGAYIKKYNKNRPEWSTLPVFIIFIFRDVSFANPEEEAETINYLL